MEPSWTEVVQAVGAIATIVIAIIGFFFVFRQLRQVERAINGATHSSLYSQSFDLMQSLAAKSELRPYFYENEVPPDTPELRQKLLIAAETVVDFHEHVVVQKPNLPKEGWTRWSAYIRCMYQTSPVLRQFLAANKEWYLPELFQLVSDILEPAPSARPAPPLVPPVKSGP